MPVYVRIIYAVNFTQDKSTVAVKIPLRVVLKNADKADTGN